MNRKRIKSSTLQSIGYDPAEETLELEFTSGDVYQYFNVPDFHYTGLIDAASHGEYFNNFIKDQFLYVNIYKKGVLK